MAQEKVPCRYCKQEVFKGIRRCPHCGTLNPTVRAKEAFIWTVGAVIALYAIGFAFKQTL